MQPYPLPLGAVRYKIFNDTIPVDGTYEADAEQGLGGFVGHITDVMGEVSTDFFGNRLCTNYVHRDHLPATDPNYTRAGDVPLAGYSRSNFDPYSPILFDDTGAPIIDTNDPGGTCYSDRNGDIVMPNLGPDRYAARRCRRRASSGTRRTRSRAATTGTCGSPRATPGTTTSSPSAPRRSPTPSWGSCPGATTSTPPAPPVRRRSA